MEASNRLLLVEEQKLVDIEKPHHHDVLCGRGVTTNRHPGNESFRSLVSLNKELYVSSTKRQKMSISRSIVEAVRSLDPPGRFLEKNPLTGMWSDIGHKKAVEKTSQALRDGAASLRKQLSADMSDPDFLNAVFDNDFEKLVSLNTAEASKTTKPESEKENSSKARGLHATTSMKEKKEQVKASEARKAPALKSKTNLVKRGHRRVNSNPCSSAAVTHQRHADTKSLDQPVSPLHHVYDNNPELSRAPHTPQPSYSSSRPKTPMTWHGRTSFSSDSPRFAGQSVSRTHFDNHSPRAFSTYLHSPAHAPYPRSHGKEYHHHTRERQHQHQHRRRNHWSFGPQYHPYPSPNRPPAHGYAPASFSPSTHQPPASPSHTSSPMSPSRPPNGPLPPGRHQFSPAGYHSRPHPPEWAHRRHQRSYYQSPRHLHAHDEYISTHSPSWRPSSPHHTSGSGYEGSFGFNQGGLSVPSLGGEGKIGRSTLSPRVALSRRPSYDSYGQTPPRIPNYPPPDFLPPKTRSAYRNLDFDADTRQTQRIVSRSSPIEEKKSDLDSHDQEPPRYTLHMKSDISSTSSKPERSEHCGTTTIKESDRVVSTSTIMADNLASAKVDDGIEGTATVEDIAMSPIPFDREDPVTLMELPEDIMSLPISSCGPNDDPVIST